VAEKKMTNIRLDPDLWARVKAAAGHRGTTLERWVTEALEGQLQRGAPAGALGGGPAGMPATDGWPRAGQDAGGRGVPADALQALHWRIEALEQAVDYLAGVVGAGFPLGAGGVAVRGEPGAAPSGHPAAAPPGDASAPATVQLRGAGPLPVEGDAGETEAGEGGRAP
jgi:hypothetical protein